MVALDPLNRRATRRTFISRASKGARRVAAERGRECQRTGKRDEGRKSGRVGGRTEGLATMRHMARARAEQQHAMQFSCRLHQSVLAGRRAHRATGLLFPSAPRPSFHLYSSCGRSTLLENASLRSLLLLYPPAQFSLSFLVPLHQLHQAHAGRQRPSSLWPYRNLNSPI